ncbi:MAG TPA: SLC13 family permease [Opitutaceae bacterium]|nr:SLC13 family permease [Opitutaceae bacterium]
MQIAVVLSLLALGIALFVSEKVSVDVVTLLLLIGLVLAGVLTPDEAFAGLSSDTVVVLAGIFVLCGAVQDSGVLNVVSGALIRAAGKSQSRLRPMLMLGVGAMAAFIHATTATALFINPTVGAARRLKISPSRLLMPLAFGSMMGGTCTLIGTSTNMAVSAYLKKAGFEPLGLFEFSLIGLTLLVIGTIYMQFVGSRLLSSGKENVADETDLSIRTYLSELVVSPDSAQVGKTLRDSAVAALGIRVLEITRHGVRFIPYPHTLLEGGDTLLVSGDKETLKAVIGINGIEIKADAELGDESLQHDDVLVAEVLIGPQSSLVNRTLRQTRFHERFSLAVLAVHRFGQTLRVKLGAINLRTGDVLLLRGAREHLENLRNTPGFIFLEQSEASRRLTRNGWWSVGFFTVAVALTATGVLPISIAFTAAALGVILVGAIKMERVYAAIEWRLLILIGGMTAFGVAMDKSGAAQLIARGVVHAAMPLGVMGILTAFCLLTIGLTQPMSNAAAALVVLPIALQTAQQLHVNPRLFAVAVMLSASLSMITPFEPSCLLVYGPGKYKFRDFVKVGGGLTLVLVTLVLLVLPRFYPIHL